MRAVAQGLSVKKYKNRDAFIYENRKQQLRVLENWYKNNLPTYGFCYQFTPREEYEND